MAVVSWGQYTACVWHVLKPWDVGSRGRGHIRLHRCHGQGQPRGRARLPRAWAAQPHTSPPLTCSGVVLHTQSATRLFLHTWLSSVTISPLFRSPGNNPGANSTLPGTTPATPGKEQKAAGHPLLGTGWSNSVSGSSAAPPGRDAIPCEGFPGFLSQVKLQSSRSISSAAFLLWPSWSLRQGESIGDDLGLSVPCCWVPLCH